MSFAALTLATLLNALNTLAAAKTERDCTEALVSGATLLQQAVLNGQDPQELSEMLESVPENLSSHMAEVFGRAVDFHQLEDGLLGLWLLPVTIATLDAFQAPVSLGAGMPSLRTGAVLLEQLGLTTQQLGGDKAGWVFPVPALYSDEQLTSAEFAGLVSLPGVARKVVQGKLKGLTFSLGQDECPAGGNTLYLPFIAYAPKGQGQVSQLNEKVQVAVEKWVRLALPANGISAQANVAVEDYPRPYSEMMNEAPRLTFSSRLRYYLYQAITASGCQPQGMVAHLSPYATPQTDGELMLGISLRSRLTRQMVGNITMPTFSDGAIQELSEAVGLMRALGFARVQVNKAPIESQLCQSCGTLQMQVPPDALMDIATLETPPSYH